MSDIHVVEPHQTNPKDAISKVAAFEDMLRKYAVKAKWSGQKAELKGPGVKGSIVVDDTNVTVDVKLGASRSGSGATCLQRRPFVTRW